MHENGEGGSKIVKNCATSFMDDPKAFCFEHRLVVTQKSRYIKQTPEANPAKLFFFVNA